MAQVDAIKTHNPFAVNDLALAADLGFPWERRMNNHGSSIIWGHPQAPTGLRGVIELIGGWCCVAVASGSSPAARRATPAWPLSSASLTRAEPSTFFSTATP